MSFPKSLYEKQMVCYNQYRQYRAARDQVLSVITYLKENNLIPALETLEHSIQCLNKEILSQRDIVVSTILERLDKEKELTVYLGGGELHLKKGPKGYQYGSINYKTLGKLSYRRDYYSQDDVKETLESRLLLN